MINTSPLRNRHLGMRLALIVVGTLFVALAPRAETLYVTDILRLGLHVSSDTSDEPFRMLMSGDDLEIIQRSRYYAEVRTNDGTVGWVKASYLTDEKPARAFLAELTRERDELAADLAGVSARLAESNGELESLRSEQEALKGSVASLTSELAAVRDENNGLSRKMAGYRLSVPLPWLLGIAALALVGGFAGGWWWTDAAQRKRHGGFRI